LRTTCLSGHNAGAAQDECLPGKERMVHCVICRIGETRPGTATNTLERDGVIVVVKHVPADVCDNCGEPYFSSEIVNRLFEILDRAIEVGVEVEVREYAEAPHPTVAA
jgi:YgiT-type zinc finger domain-containing protein